MLRFVEIASACILALCAAVEARRGPAALRAFLRDAGLIGLSGWLAEDVCIRLFGFYGYSDGWMLRADQVPLLIGCIWPFVVLSAREVARVLGKERGLALRTGLVIVFDAALIEPVAVRAGLWSWSEPGLFGVPLVGVLGWGVFGALCVWFLALCDAWTARSGRLFWRRLLLPVVTCLSANALLFVLWWALLRWFWRGPVSTRVALALVSASSLLFLSQARGKRGAFPFGLSGPRAVAAALFFALIAAVGDRWLWFYAMPFALPYLWLSARSARAAGSLRPVPSAFAGRAP